MPVVDRPIWLERDVSVHAVGGRTLTDAQKRQVNDRLEAVITKAYADQPVVYPSLIEELCYIIRFAVDPPPGSPDFSED